MQDRDWALLDSLASGASEHKNPEYWLKRSSEVIATSTQSRDLYPVMDYSRGQGSRVYDLEGNEYLDVTSGVAVRALGVRYPPLVEFERQITHVVEELPGQDFDHIPQVLLAEKLIGITPGKFDKQVFFTTSGARAVETAVKSAMDNTQRTRFVAFRPAFHGRTGYALSLTASKGVHRERFPSALPVIRAPYPYSYRRPRGLSPDEYAALCADQVEDAIEREGADVAGIVVEPITGEGGMIPSPDTFLPRLRAIADRYGAWLIVDEVQSGLGRTGKWWAFEHYGVTPDVVCTAKALGGGWPMGATIGRSPMFTRGSRHSETFSAEPRQALISLFVLTEIERKGYIQNAARMGEVLSKGLKELEQKHDCVGEARGLGLMQGIEIVESKQSAKPAPARRDAILKAAIHGERLMLLGAGENTIRLLPSLNVTEEEVREALARLDRAISAASRAS